MVEKREIVIQLRKGYAIRKINRNLKVHRDVIRSVQRIAEKKGWLKPGSHMPDNKEIEQALCPKPAAEPSQIESFDEKIKQWHVEGVNAVVIQRFLKETQLHVEISTLRRHIRKLCPQSCDPVMVRQTKPGEVMDVDFGFLGVLWDTSQEKFRKVWFFSGRLRHSRKAFRILVWEQTIKTFIICHILAFEYFGGVPETVCLDNLKAGVIKSTVDNDMLNRTYRELAEYYDFMISPCLPRTPEHKGGVESDVKYSKGNWWPQIKEKKKSNPKLTFEEAQRDLDKWGAEVADTRNIRVMRRSPDEIFTSEEKNCLKRLPEGRFELTSWFQCIVRREWWIIYKGSSYSVPSHLIGKTVDVRVTNGFLKVFFEHEEVAHHELAKQKGEYKRNPKHAPPYKEEVLSCNRQGLLLKASEIGEATHQFFEKMLSDKHIDKLRALRHTLDLAEKYGRERLNNACKRALSFNTIMYSSIKNILEKELDKLTIAPQQAQEAPKPQFKYARDPQEYSCVDNSKKAVNE